MLNKKIKNSMRSILFLFVAFFTISCGGSSAQSAETGSSNESTPASAATTSENTVQAPHDDELMQFTPAGPRLAQREPLESPDIQITLQGLQTPAQATLLGHFAEQRFRADSVQIGANGAIRFKRDEPFQPGFYYVVVPNQAVVQLLIDQDQSMQLQANAADVIGTMQIKGNQENQVFYQNLKFEESQKPAFAEISQKMQGLQQGSPEYQALKEQQDKLIAERRDHLKKLFTTYPNTLFTAFKRAGQNPVLKEPKLANGEIDTQTQVEIFRQEFWDGVDFSDKRLLYTPVIFNKLKRYITELTAQNPVAIGKSTDELMAKVSGDDPAKKEYFKFFANWITLNYEPTKTTLMDAEGVYVHMVQNYFTKERAFWTDSMTVYGLQQRASEMAASLVGQPAPNVISYDPNGQETALLDLKAEYLVVYMYNPTCEHCMEETPKLVQLYPTLKQQNGDVYGIALDTDHDEWTGYIRKTGMTWTNVFDPSNRSIYKKYYVDVTPEIYVINPDRKIIAKNIKVNQIMEVIRMDRERRQ